MSRQSGEHRNSEPHQRSHTNSGDSGGGGGGGMSSHPPDVNNAHVTNVDKLEKDLKSQQEQPVEQHRSSRRPRTRQHKSH